MVDLIDVGARQTAAKSPKNAGPLDWDTYVAQSMGEYRRLLDEMVSERAMQKFLERNPSFVPGVNSYSSGQHSPLGGVLYSQPRLRGIARDRLPDFMWLGKSSAELTPVLIEIESPSKTWFTKRGTQRATFTQAYGQLTEWRSWFSHPENQIAFRRRYYSWPAGINARLPMRPIYLLIYGRRSEFESDCSGELVRFRASLRRSDEEVMTFDRLAPERSLRDVISVRQKSNGVVKPIAVPASLTTGPTSGETALKVGPITELLAKLDEWTSERRTWIDTRWSHWAKVAADDVTRPLSLGKGE